MSTRYYATTRSNSTISYWTQLSAKTMTGAKRLAWQEHGSGYLGDVVAVVAVEAGMSGRINDLPYHTRLIASGSRWSTIPTT